MIDKMLKNNRIHPNFQFLPKGIKNIFYFVELNNLVLKFLLAVCKTERNI
jgi:hypothetical protein